MLKTRGNSAVVFLPLAAIVSVTASSLPATVHAQQPPSTIAGVVSPEADDPAAARQVNPGSRESALVWQASARSGVAAEDVREANQAVQQFPARPRWNRDELAMLVIVLVLGALAIIVLAP